jgi:hypothetical protein
MINRPLCEHLQRRGVPSLDTGANTFVDRFRILEGLP